MLSSRWQPARGKKFEIEICGIQNGRPPARGERNTCLTSHDLEKKPKKVYSTSTLLVSCVSEKDKDDSSSAFNASKSCHTLGMKRKKI